MRWEVRYVDDSGVERVHLRSFTTREEAELVLAMYRALDFTAGIEPCGGARHRMLLEGASND